MLRKFFLLNLLLILFFFFPVKTFAADNSFLTIVNPVRISDYVKTPGESLATEYTEISKRGLPATWLLTYDAIVNDDIKKATDTFNQDQEFGIFLEVTPEFAQKSGVVYNKKDSWHRAASLFLIGYLQEDRKKLLDTVFEKFHERFGYYPKSVGSWWTDAYSLDYISKKYGVT